MAERSLAHIEKIAWVKPIEGADNIELIGVLGWVCIAKKGEFKSEDICVYFEIDSKLPEADWSEFMRSKHFKVKTMKLSRFNVISQGLALPIQAIPELQDKNLSIGLDVTELLKITYSVVEDNIRKSKSSDPDAKYKSMAARHKELFKKKPIRWLMKRDWGRKLLFLFFGKKKDNPKQFPEWIHKTDETRIENAPFYLENTEPWIKTEKLDGCLDPLVSVVTDVGIKRIGEIVNHKLPVKVLSWNNSRKKCEWKPIEEYHKWKRVSDMYDIVVKQKGYTGGNKQKHIKCTSEHKFYVGNGKYIKAKDLKLSDPIYHRCKSINSLAKQILLGILLGDGSLSSKYGKLDGAVDFSHSEKQKEYLEETIRLLDFNKISVRELISGYGSKMIAAHYYSNYELKEFLENFCYDSKTHKKRVTKEWANELTPISLAFWYMDDGSISNADSETNSPRISIATNGFDYEECVILTDMLKNRFNIEATIATKESYKGNRLILDTINTEKFGQLIAPYICDTMKYKLPKQLRDIDYCLKKVVATNGESIIKTDIISINKIDDYKGKYVYDLTISDNSNYFANGILTHNTSSTYALDLMNPKIKKGDFIVCSRNVRQKDEEQTCYHECGNVYWEMADKYNIETALRGIAIEFNAKRVILQGETYGLAVQGNPYKLKERRFAAFNLIIDGIRFDSVRAKEILEPYCIPFVPIVDTKYYLPKDMETFKLEADGKSLISDVPREGFVYRSLDGTNSFKNVSREFLLKHS